MTKTINEVIYNTKSANHIIKKLNQLGDLKRAKLCQRYFKTYAGGYAEGDRFLGITTPVQRKIAREYMNLDLVEIGKLLKSGFHEVRFTGLAVLVLKYRKSDESEKGKVVAFYLKNRKSVNNWDLVDSSAPHILGDWLLCRDRSVLYDLAISDTIWDRRIAIISTAMFIRNGDFDDTLHLAEILLNDHHDLIHKAVGWMLREVGKKSEKVLERFLVKNGGSMPRTMLRYAVEKFPMNKRKRYLSLGR